MLNIKSVSVGLKRGAMTLLLAATTFTAQAESKFPSGTITLVVGYPPGGSNDLIARIYAPALTEALGAPVIVMNKPGADATIGTEYTVNAKPDGYTITLGSTSALSISEHMVSHLPYNPLTDLAAITTVASSTGVLAINPKVPAKTMQELIDLSKTRQVTLASAGVGGISHLNIEMLRLKTKGNFLHVPYKGAVPAMTDVVGGQVDGIVMDYAPLAGMINQGRLRGVGASSAVGSIPKSDMVVAAWYAVEAPAKTPREVVNLLNAAFIKAANNPKVKAGLANLNMQPMTQPSPEAATAFIQADSARWGGVVKAAGIEPN